MRHARNLFAAAVLVLALSSSTFAGVLVGDRYPPPPPPPDTATQAPATDSDTAVAAIVTAIVLYGISWSG
jgi:Na+-transporting methylmalonyl-CoA/oxaloacetate decarboxylase gamma subunit